MPPTQWSLAWIEFRSRPERQTILSAGDLVRIGRGQGNDIVVDDPQCWREHALIRVEGGVPVIYAATRTNGVLVDGRWVRESVERSRTVGTTTRPALDPKWVWAVRFAERGHLVAISAGTRWDSEIRDDKRSPGPDRRVTI
ncbi:MAG: FHA domain-containing protein [Tepidiformaceae bacterium]